jgi:hypothetical protein
LCNEAASEFVEAAEAFSEVVIGWNGSAKHSRRFDWTCALILAIMRGNASIITLVQRVLLSIYPASKSRRRRPRKLPKKTEIVMFTWPFLCEILGRMESRGQWARWSWRIDSSIVSVIY